MTLYWQVQRRWSWVQWRVSSLMGRLMYHVEPWLSSVLRVTSAEIRMSFYNHPDVISIEDCDFFHTQVCQYGPIKRWWLWRVVRHIRRWFNAK